MTSTRVGESCGPLHASTRAYTNDGRMASSSSRVTQKVMALYTRKLLLSCSARWRRMVLASRSAAFMTLERLESTPPLAVATGGVPEGGATGGATVGASPAPTLLLPLSTSSTTEAASRFICCSLLADRDAMGAHAFERADCEKADPSRWT